MFILVYEGNTYNLLVQMNYFQRQSPIDSLQKCVLQICSKFTGGHPYWNVISKKVAWHICMGALFLDWSKTFSKVFFILWYILRNSFIIFQMLAVIQAPILFSFQSLVKQMFLVMAQAVPHRCSSRKII